MDAQILPAVVAAVMLIAVAWLLVRRRRRQAVARELEWRGGDVFDLGPSGAIAAAEYALARFEDVGVDLPRENRLTRARRLIGRVNSGSLALTSDDPATIRKVTAAQWTILEFYLIARAAGSNVPRSYLDKVRMALGGSDLPEHDKNHLHRNTGFELTVAAILTMGDIPVMLAEPDLVARLDSRLVGVAAKRVQGERAIRSRMKEARDQIVASGKPGLIAISADVITLNSRPMGDAQSKGRTIDEKLGEVHKADDDLIGEEALLGRIAFARTALWSFEGGRPRLQQDMFRQVRIYSRSEDEGAGIQRALEEAEALIETRLRNL